MNKDTSYGSFLKLIQVQHGDSLAQMAEKLGVSVPYLSAIKKGTREIPAGFSLKVTDAYDLSLEDMAELMVQDFMVSKKRDLTVNLEDKIDDALYVRTAVQFIYRFTDLTREQVQQLSHVLMDDPVEDPAEETNRRLDMIEKNLAELTSLVKETRDIEKTSGKLKMIARSKEDA